MRVTTSPSAAARAGAPAAACAIAFCADHITTMRRQCKTLALRRPYTASMVRRGGHRKPSSMAERADGWGGAGSGGRARGGAGW